jgi:very-short-patch-repair endonuclease
MTNKSRRRRLGLRKVLQLRTTFLIGNPFANHLDPATSLYELAGMVYPGRAIILREHFRCVEPIIGFSSGFYPKPLIPLRVATASERLDPPLIDLYVPHGRRLRDVNEAEVDVIVSEITNMVTDPIFEGRSIGVISLIGSAQANRIYTRLITQLGAEVIQKHRMMCGNAATFQGQERDIVFLSMVACPETAVAQTSRVFEQRFNVAASRARDRLILVRSVASSDLKPGDLKLALIEHFRAPMTGNLIKPKEVLEVCDSEFERDFGRCLLDLGYRIRPQVPVGGYAIDFVIEGRDDRRLAIELDGDKYHGPDRWAEDIKRQRALERLGWTFWRCWGSAWISDREGCLADLMATLHRLSIEPIGTGEIDGAFTEHIEVRVPADKEPVIDESIPAGSTPVQPSFPFGQAIPRERLRAA